MATYITTNKVIAEPMTLSEFGEYVDEDMGIYDAPEKEGFLVKTECGTTSWTPKDEFLERSFELEYYTVQQLKNDNLKNAIIDIMLPNLENKKAKMHDLMFLGYQVRINPIIDYNSEGPVCLST